MTTITLNASQLSALKSLLSSLTTIKTAPKAKASNVTKLPSAAKAATKSDPKAAFAAKVVSTFARQGVKVTPNVDVFTYNRWLANGFKVIPGQKAVRVDGVPMFHRGQVAKV